MKKVTKKKSLKKILVIPLLLLGLVSAVTLTQQRPSLNQYASTGTCTETLSDFDQGQIDSVIQAAMTKYAVPGASLAISKDGRLVYTKGYGLSNKTTSESATPSTRFRIASTTKPMTATGVMILVQAGKINLDGKVFGPSSILGTTYTSKPKDSRINNITVRQLLAHTSGFWTNDANDPIYMPASYSQSQLITTSLQTRRLQSNPGSRYSYSNFGYIILGRVIEKVTGQTYTTWMNANVFAPSGITNMQLAGTTLAERAANEAVYYSSYGNPYSYSLARVDAAGGYIGTATDLVRFGVRMDGLATPADLVNSSTLNLMTTATPQSITAGAYYGLGWTLNGQTWLHIGNTWGTAAMIVRQPDGYTWAILENSDAPEKNNVVDVFYQLPPKLQAVTSWPNCDLF